MEPLFPWAAAIAAALSGFFSLNVCALRDPSRRDLEAAFAARNRSGRRLNGLLAHISELRMICALIRSVCNLALLVLLLLTFDASGNIIGILAGLVVAACVISIFTIAIPYAWARYAGPKVLAVTSGVLLSIRKAFWPVVFVMRAFDMPVRRLSGVPDPLTDQVEKGSNGRKPSPLETAVKAEILQVASDGQAEGAVDPEEVEMIESVIEFGDQHAGEIMTPRTDIVALPVGATLERVRQTVVNAGHTRIPVYDGDIDNIVGILYAKDLLAIEDAAGIDLAGIVRKPFFVPETKPLDDLLREFKARKMHMAVVLDEYGGTAGLVTVEDLIEEIVGDISDEYDRTESPLMKRIDEETIEVDGRMYIDDFNDAVGMNLPEEEDYDTVAGFVFSELGVIPQEGQTLTIGKATFTVLEADAHKIKRLRVEIPSRKKTPA